MEKRMLITGAGIAGLSTGYAQMNGYKTTISNAHDPGTVHCLKRRYTFDISMHNFVGFCEP
jgi:thioredoxin reductase